MVYVPTTSQPYYGYPRISIIAARFIYTHFPTDRDGAACPQIWTATPPPPATPDVYFLANSIARIIYLLRIPQAVVFCALHLLYRLQSIGPAMTQRAAALVALIIAHKFHCGDRPRPSRLWAIAGGSRVFDVAGLRLFEAQMLEALDWRLNVTYRTYDAFRSMVISRFG